MIGDAEGRGGGASVPRMSVSMRVKRSGTAIGHFLGLWCLGFGALNLLFFQSFAASGDPSRFNDGPEGLWRLVTNILVGGALIILGGLIARFASATPSQILGGWGLAKLWSVLAFSLLASALAVVRLEDVVSGDVGFMGVIAEVWLAVAGATGLALCTLLGVRRRQLLQHQERNVRR